MTGSGIHVPTKSEEETGEMAPETPREEPAAAVGPAPAAPPRKGASLGAIVPFFLEYFREIRRGLKWLRAAPKPETSPMKRAQKGLVLWSKARKARIGMATTLGIILASYGVFAMQVGSTPTEDCKVVVCGDGGGGGGGGGGTGNNATLWANGTVAENGDETYVLDLERTSFATLRVVLTWTDEPASALQVNQPDSLNFSVEAPNGFADSTASATNPGGGTGSVSWSLPENMTAADLGGTTWTFTVHGGMMGDYTRPSGRACVLCPTDTSNAFSLRVDWTW